MKILFVIGAGILPEQRVERWKMVSSLYARLGASFRQLGHQIYYYVHEEAYTPEVPASLTWICNDHEHLPLIMETYAPDFVFCWNGSSLGDVATSSICHSYGAKMIYSEQGWFPQSSTLYFDMTGCNGKCGTKNKAYPLLTEMQADTFLKARAEYIESVGIDSLFNKYIYQPVVVDLSKPIFVPLQDERDLNIVQDSPFKTMDEFVSFLIKIYPNQKFLVRPHPKYPKPSLSLFDNVIIDDCKKPMFESLVKCSMVIGINSTTLLESSLLGYKVISFGEGLATGTGLFLDADVKCPPKIPDDVMINREKMMAVLYHLLCVKQFYRNNLGNPIAIMKSPMFQDLLKNLNWNSIYR